MDFYETEPQFDPINSALIGYSAFENTMNYIFKFFNICAFLTESL